MHIPETTVLQRHMEPEEEDYCAYLNTAIALFVTTKGNKRLTDSGFEHRFQNQHVKLYYLDSAWNNYKFAIAVSRLIWDEVPESIRHLVTEDGWNHVYNFQDSPDRKIIHQLIPGEWIHIFDNVFEKVDIRDALDERASFDFSVKIDTQGGNAQVNYFSPGANQTMTVTETNENQLLIDIINGYRRSFDGAFQQYSENMSQALDLAQKALNANDKSEWEKAFETIKWIIGACKDNPIVKKIINALKGINK